ncbi:hypothetical protein GF324_04560 [bacterium]|nr:hypothetical protein [bacterium]
MRNIGGKLLILLIVAFMVAFAGVGCTKYASEEDLQTLEQQRQAALSAEKKVTELERKKADLEREKAVQQSKVDAAKEEKAKVEQRMQERGTAEEQPESQMMEGGQ